MEIVLENPSPPSSSSSSTATSQLGLPIHAPHHFPHRTVYDVGLRRSPPLLPADEYYARTRHGLTSYGDLDGASAPVTVRRVDKSGLLEIAETDPVTCPRPCVLTGAEDVGARGVSLRVDRTGLLEAVPEAADQSEEHCNNTVSSDERGGTSVMATRKTSDEATAVPPSRGGTLKVDVDVNPHVFEGGCLLERPSSLEGQACPDEVDARVRSTDVMVLTGSPRTRYDVSKAAERLSHLPFSPGLSLRHLRKDPPRVSPLLGRHADADADRSCNQKSPEFIAKYNPANATPRKLAKLPQSPKTTGGSKGKLDSMSSDSGEPVIDTSRTSDESLLLAKRSADQEDDLPGEERAEAEGCEHTTVESLEEDKVSFKGSNKLLDNDNVQTLRVIILSEQL